MSIVVNIYYSGKNGSARKFAKEMISSGTVDAIRNEAGNIRYDYFFPLIVVVIQEYLSLMFGF